MKDFYLSSEELAETARKYVREYPEHAEAALQLRVMLAAMSSRCSRVSMAELRSALQSAEMKSIALTRVEVINGRREP